MGKIKGWDKKYKTLQCGKNYCSIKINGQRIYIVKTKYGIKTACNYGDKVINLSSKRIWYCKDMNNVFQKDYDSDDVVVMRFE